MELTSTIARPRVPESASIDAVDAADLRDLSPVLAGTSEALRQALVDGDIDASVRLFDDLVDQLPDRRSVVTDVLVPLVSTERGHTADRRRRDDFVRAAAEMFTRVRRPVATSGVDAVLLSAACLCIDALTLSMAALLLDDVGVPASLVVGAADDIVGAPEESCGLSCVCLAICDPSRLPDSEYVVRSLRIAGTAVVLAGDALRDEPDLVNVVGASAGSWHPGYIADLLLRLRGPLTAAEADVLSLAASGCTNVRIAHELGISVSGVKARLESAYAKAQAADRAHAVAIALRQRWIR